MAHPNEEEIKTNEEGKREEGPQGLLNAPAAEKALRQNQGARRAFGQVTVGGFFTPQLFTFRPNEFRLLKEMMPGVTLEEAAKKAGVPVEFALRTLKRKAVREFLQDKYQQVAIQDGWTVQRWHAEGDAVWRGHKVVTREQLEVWKEFGARILPKARAGGGSENVGEKPQITINIGAVDEAFRRQQAIKAEIVDATEA